MEERVKRRLATSAALVAALATPFTMLSAQRRNPCAVDTTQWVFELTPYAWASMLVGEVGVRERSAHVNLSIGDVLEHLDGAVTLGLEARKGRVSYVGEILWVRLSDSRARPGRIFTGASAKSSSFLGELGPRIRVATTKHWAIDALFGARLWSLKSDVTLNLANRPDITSDLTKTWVDVFGGYRTTYLINDRWFLQSRGDVGGFQSKFTWQTISSLGYNASERFMVRAGYRYIDVDYRDRDESFLYDVAMGGPILGLTFRF
jgi:hypothetical protein